MSESKAFGPTALLTPANALTAARLVAAPLFALLVVYRGPSAWLLAAAWTVLTFTDGLDGRVARWHGTTRSGAFLDPLADKFLVLGALAALADLHYVSVWPVVIIAVREVSMSLFRVYAAHRGVSIPARAFAKLKTLVQDVAIATAFIPPLSGPHPGVCRTLVWIAVALTVASGISYLADGRRLLRSEVVADKLPHASAV